MDSEGFSEILKGSPAIDFLDGYEEIGHHGNTVIGRLVRHGQIWFVKSYVQSRDNEEARLRLRKEYEVLLKLNHSGIVRAGWLEELPGVGMSLIMEMVEGETLDKYLEHADRTERRLISDALLEVVAYIHSQNVCHLDLKPQNIMVVGHDRNIRLKICDFGMSDWSGSALFKNSGGTRGFSDPEQFKVGYKPTPSSDVYSLGCLLKMINGGRVYAHVAKSAADPRIEHRPEDASALIEMVRCGKRKRRVIYSVIGLICGVAVLILIFINKRDSENYGNFTDPQASMKAIVGQAADSVAAEIRDFGFPASRQAHNAVEETRKGKIEEGSDIGSQDPIEKEYSQLVEQWNGELDRRTEKIREIAACDTLSREGRRRIIEKMMDDITEDTWDFFLPFVERTGGKAMRPIYWGTIYDPVFLVRRKKLSLIYDSLKD